MNTTCKRVAFTGHRVIPENDYSRIKNEVRSLILNFYNDGYREFRCGMAVGFDLLVAEEVLELKSTICKDARFIACIPFEGQEDLYSTKDKIRYYGCMSMADAKVVIGQKDNKNYLRRNDYMIEHSDTLIAYHDPRKRRSGTGYTVARALAAGIQVVYV